MVAFSGWCSVAAAPGQGVCVVLLACHSSSAVLAWLRLSSCVPSASSVVAFVRVALARHQRCVRSHASSVASSPPPSVQARRSASEISNLRFEIPLLQPPPSTVLCYFLFSIFYSDSAEPRMKSNPTHLKGEQPKPRRAGQASSV